MATTARQDAANQPPPLEGHNLFLENRPLRESLEREGAGWAAEQAATLGALLSGEPLEWARQANEHPPRLRTHDRFGNRIDEVEFHPSWHALMRRASSTASTRSPGASRGRARTSPARRSSSSPRRSSRDTAARSR
jgi:putative acyl-CoA dehydrogenase